MLPIELEIKNTTDNNTSASNNYRWFTICTYFFCYERFILRALRLSIKFPKQEYVMEYLKSRLQKFFCQCGYCMQIFAVPSLENLITFWSNAIYTDTFHRSDIMLTYGLVKRWLKLDRFFSNLRCYHISKIFARSITCQQATFGLLAYGSVLMGVKLAYLHTFQLLKPVFVF